MKKELRFIHLRVHSEYSLLEGAIALKNLGKYCIDNKMPAVAVTDTNNMFAALEFSTVLSTAGVQPIVGCQMEIIVDVEKNKNGKIDDKQYLVLLAQNQVGYNNLLKLNSVFYLGNTENSIGLSIKEVCDHNEGLICLTGGSDGPIGRQLINNNIEQAKADLLQLKSSFSDRLYVEVQRHPISEGRYTEHQISTEEQFIQLAYDLDLPLVATNDVYFPNREMLSLIHI